MDCEIPLLFSKKYLKEGECKLDFVNDTCELLGQKIVLQNTSSGHYCIPISPRNLVGETSKVKPSKQVLDEVYVTIDNLEIKYQYKPQTFYSLKFCTW